MLLSATMDRPYARGWVFSRDAEDVVAVLMELTVQWPGQSKVHFFLQLQIRNPDGTEFTHLGLPSKMGE